jgi:predicted DNA-binding transcriptional regulator AlpA
MKSENELPRFVRFRDLRESGIAETLQTVKHLQKEQGFPLGRLLGPNTRAWTVEEVKAWLASRPVEVSEQAKRRAQRSLEARRASAAVS